MHVLKCTGEQTNVISILDIFMIVTQSINQSTKMLNKILLTQFCLRREALCTLYINQTTTFFIFFHIKMDISFQVSVHLILRFPSRKYIYIQCILFATTQKKIKNAVDDVVDVYALRLCLQSVFDPNIRFLLHFCICR